MTFKTWIITISTAVLLWVITLLAVRYTYNKLEPVVCTECKIYTPDEVEHLG